MNEVWIHVADDAAENPPVMVVLERHAWDLAGGPDGDWQRRREVLERLVGSRPTAAPHAAPKDGTESADGLSLRAPGRKPGQARTRSGRPGQLLPDRLFARHVAM